MNNIFPRLVDLPQNIKYFLAAFLLLMSLGVSLGLVYVYETTEMTSGGTEEHYTGSTPNDDMDIPEKYPKELESMLLTTHTHLISFSFIFFFLGLIFYMNSTITGGWKTFIIIEPFISVLITFGSIWGVRYSSLIYSNYIILFGILTYLSFYLMVAMSLYELLVKKP
jgi:hypothetical protein